MGASAASVKLYTARQAVSGASEAVEAFGAAEYMEDTGIARLLRDAQVLTIWEGTTNVLSLDVLRTLARPGVADARQRYARELAFEAAEACIAGLLREAAGRGLRQAAVWELWESRRSGGEADRPGAEHFELVVDGAA